MSVTHVTLRHATKEEALEARGGCLSSSFSRVWKLFNRVITSVQMYRHGANILEWKTPLPMAIVNGASQKLGLYPSFMYEFPTFFGDTFMITDEEKVMRAVFSLHRNGEIFSPNRSSKLLFDLLVETFPETKFDLEDFMLTCTSEKTGFLHRMMHSALKKTDEIVKFETENALTRWAQQGRVNITSETRQLASRIITRILLGQKADSEELCNSINYINEFIILKVTGTATREQVLEYKYSLNQFREATLKILEEQVPLFEGYDLTEAQKKAMVLIAFFAGQETTASLMNHMLWRLASDPDESEMLQKMSVDDYFSRAITAFPPAYGISRKITEDTCLEYRLKGEETTRKIIFFAGQFLGIRMIDAARHLQAKSQNGATNLGDWFPFGGGPHRCPGQGLAMAEVKEMIKALKSNRFSVECDEEDISLIGFVTLQLAEEVWVDFKEYHNIYTE